MTQTFDASDLAAVGLRAMQDEEAWIAKHEGALAASELGGCLRKPKFRLNGEERTNPPSVRSLRRMAMGLMAQDAKRKEFVAAGRRPRLNAEVEVTVGGMRIVGSPDFVFTEAVVEYKTTGAWRMDAEHLPFPHTMQLGTYMYGLDKPGQLFYSGAWGMEEWTFDFPALPEMWAPQAQHVAELFAANPGPEIEPYPATRQWCASCPYLDACPTEDLVEGATLTEEQHQLFLDAVVDWERETAAASATKKTVEDAKQRVLGFREFLPQEKEGVHRLALPGKVVIIKDVMATRLDQKQARALLESKKLNVPTSVSTSPRITVKAE